MMIGMSGLGLRMGFGVLLFMHAISGWEGEGYWFKVFLSCGLEAMTGACIESYEAFSYMRRIIIHGFLYSSIRYMPKPKRGFYTNNILPLHGQKFKKQKILNRVGLEPTPLS